LYTGVTSDPIKHIWQHRNDCVASFTRTYAVHTLVYYEVHEDMLGAIAREKQIKQWRRRWKLNLIEARNPHWVDLWGELCGVGGWVGKWCGTGTTEGGRIPSSTPTIPTQVAVPAPTYNLNRCTIPFKSLANLAN
ncbi:MAG: GIY-YIG nuclease family protein, partial [Pseudomonas sp.]|uniref:GIY-YIG nuclease family protein n=1 Tax=Pseudomonas sp. TaxID=306 RepID=UPI0030F26987